MIVGRDDLADLRGTVTMVDGGFDPLHPGHVAYFEAAAELGHPVLCSVSPDSWVAAKHAPLLSQAERVAVIDAFRAIDYTYAAAEPTVEVLRLLAPVVYAKGADWEGRLPEAETATCAELGIAVAFLDTVTHSSSALLERWRGG
jgi:D-beta-D-heptose 7-phosphate kinase/D-beta-D-heptose 1-phosphate adenosyltransferase